MITVSIVSHRHGEMLAPLLAALNGYPEVSRVVLTHNIPEPRPTLPEALSEKTIVLANPAPLGFGANHNQAFKHCNTPFYCVLNPDVQFTTNPFPALIPLIVDSGHALCAPAVTGLTGEIEDSARHFPTLPGLLSKATGGDDGRYPYRLGDPPFEPDWIAGMFMLFDASAFRRIAGFDEGFFLYYEDVDICARLWLSGFSIALQPAVSIIHAAQRASHRELRYLRWHLGSMVRYFTKHPFLRINRGTGLGLRH